MSVHLSLHGAQVKQFKNALQCLNKIGSELLVEAANEVVQTGVLLKHVLATFRTKAIARYEIQLDTARSQTLVCVQTDIGLSKRYRIECLQADILQATVDVDSFPTKLVAEVGELGRLLSSFQAGQDEVTLFASPSAQDVGASGHRACQLQSFLDPAKAKTEGSLHAAVAIDACSVFLHYSHQSSSQSDCTFNIKDFRAMVSLCEALHANITIRMDSAGMPLVIEPHFRGAEASDIRAELVLSTLMESQLPVSQAPGPPPLMQGQQPGRQQQEFNNQQQYQYQQQQQQQQQQQDYYQQQQQQLHEQQQQDHQEQEQQAYHSSSSRRVIYSSSSLMRDCSLPSA
ncbi:Rad9-domain-containing protein [Haematococcus lacustris]